MLLVVQQAQIIDLTPMVSDVLLTTYAPGESSDSAFVGRLVRRGPRRWGAIPLMFGSYEVDPNRARTFRKRSDAVDWLIAEVQDQLVTAAAAQSVVAGEA